MNRNKVLSKAVEECIKELYSLAQPHIDWKEFIEECKNYSNRFQTWDIFRRAQIKKNEFPQEWEHQKIVHPNWENKSITECIGPCPCEYYYLPKDIMDDIVDSYIRAYKIDNHRELLDTIEILKNYCNEPIIGGESGYDRTACLKARIVEFLEEHYDLYDSEYKFEDSQEILDMFFEFLDMAGNFYKWNGELNSFNTEIYLGVSPSSDKQAVIDNWKIYRKTNIKINDSEYDEYDEE